MKEYTHNFYDSLLDYKDNTVYVAKKVYGILMNYMNINSVVDVGCGVGTWLRVMQDLGRTDIMGIDGYWVDEEQLLIPNDKFKRQDLNERISIERRFDIAQTLEVAEHLNPERSDSFIEDLTRLSDVILFSAAIPYQGGVGHINEQWPSYWIKKFDEHGYEVFDVIRTELWDDNKVTLRHYKQNLLLFIKKNTENTAIGKEMSKNATHIYDMTLPAIYESNAGFLNSVLNSKKYRYAEKLTKVLSIFRKKR